MCSGIGQSPTLFPFYSPINWWGGGGGTAPRSPLSYASFIVYFYTEWPKKNAAAKTSNFDPIIILFNAIGFYFVG